VFHIGVVAGQDVADLGLGRGDPPLDELPLPHQGAVLTNAGRRAMGLGDHVQSQELGQDLGVQLVGLASALGDHAELAGMSQQHAFRQRLHELDEPLVAGRGLDDDLERAQAAKELADRRAVLTGQPLPLHDGSLRPLLHDDTETDNLLVEVDADVLHGPILSVETGSVCKPLPVYHALKDAKDAARPPLIASSDGDPLALVLRA